MQAGSPADSPVAWRPRRHIDVRRIVRPIVRNTGLPDPGQGIHSTQISQTNQRLGALIRNFHRLAPLLHVRSIDNVILPPRHGWLAGFTARRSPRDRRAPNLTCARRTRASGA